MYGSENPKVQFRKIASCNETATQRVNRETVDVPIVKKIYVAWEIGGIERF